jgi:3-phytase
MGPDKPVMTSNQVTPDSETWPVLSEDDAADDPAIYLHPSDSSRNYFYGTDKQAGLEAYYTYGPRFFILEFGPINNADIRYNFPLNDELIDFIAATDRYTNSIKVFRINPDNGMIKRIDSRRILSGMDEVYGFCLYNDLENNIFYGFITGKGGGVEQWRLYATPEDEVGGEFVRFLDVQTQSEGCVADDELGWFYVAEEDVGILKFPAQPDKEAVATLVDDLQNPDLEADIEGLTIYYTADGGGYLIASSQGNNSYAVYERTGENTYLGSFSITDRVEDGKVVIDGTSDTDGIDVINHSFGGLFPKGVFIAQDGENTDQDGNPERQNFKMVSWEKIAKLFDPPLDIDTTYNVRTR